MDTELSKKPLKIRFADIPIDKDIEDYPDDTIFTLGGADEDDDLIEWSRNLDFNSLKNDQ